MQPNRARYVRVLIAADHPPPIDKIRGLVFPDFEIVGTVKGVGERVLRRAFELRPDVILVEVAEAIKDHFKVVTTLTQRLPHSWIIFFQNGTGPLARAASADTSSSVRRRNNASSDSSTVERESDHAMSGRRCALNDAHHSLAHLELQELSGREYEVLALLAAGYPMKEIAFRLGITYRTVTFHKYRMMERLGVSTNADLIAYALRNPSTNVGQREPTAVA
jgi:DNA-binding NarL/FixJ family response regulator